MEALRTLVNSGFAAIVKWRRPRYWAAIAVAFGLGTSALAQMPLTISTNPVPPQANQPFQVLVSGNLIPNLEGGTPSVAVDGSTITVFLNRECGFLCPGYGFSTQTVQAPALLPGSYQMTVYQGGPPATDVPLAGFVGVLALSVPTVNYTGLWWKSPAGSESGWGVSIEHQGDILFCVWYTYGADGNGVWLVMSHGMKTGDGTYSGALYRTTGPAFDATPWNPASVGITPVGSATLSFSDANNGLFTYTYNSVTQSKAITRQYFGAPGQ
jgi:hypothetical protein